MSQAKQREITGFQEGAPYDETIDLRTDFVMAYGMNTSTPDRIARWKQAGYQVHLMTGISWGSYQDYLEGRWDGQRHWDDAQTAADGTAIQHGRSTDMPYMVPTIGFTEYLIEKLRPVIALGVEGIHLEEPEFWARAGYSESFKREWQAYFGEPWQAPHGSVEAHFRSGQLKRHLLARSLDRVTTVLKDEALQQGRRVRFYVPTHSLLNYTQWQIISPESDLRRLVAIDGAIAQVWTGTSRTPNVYSGQVAERTFETAFLEYGIAQDLVRGTGRTLWFLHDPIEDHPDRTWEDYLANYQRTLVASLLHPGVSRYEVTPWPNRYFNGKYPRENAEGRHPIPADSATRYLIAMNTLRDMDQPSVEWVNPGPRVGVFLSDTAMFQRWRPDDGTAGSHYDGLQDALAVEGRDQLHFSDFYGLALPPLLDGQQVSPVQLESLIDDPSSLDEFDVLVLSYEFQKPMTPAIHYSLAGWVSRGGCLLYVGDGGDPYHGIREWWTGRYATCAHHLAEALGIDADDATIQQVGRGWAQFLPKAPASFTESAGQATELLSALQDLARRGGHEWHSHDWLGIRRGPYLAAAVLSSATAPVRMEGTFLDLLSADLRLVRDPSAAPGAMVWMRALDGDVTDPHLLAAAGRIEDWVADGSGVRYRCEAPHRVQVTTALRMPSRPSAVRLDGADLDDWRYDEQAKVLWLSHPGVPAGTSVEVLG